MRGATSEKQLWMLDTNIISALMRQPGGEVARRMVHTLSKIKDAQICTSLIVDCELRFGLQKNPNSRYTHAYQVAIASIAIMAMDTAVVQHYATIRAHLEKAGTPIGPNDTLIAAHALALDCTLVTDNETEFRRVPGLRVENWLAGIAV